MDSITDKEMSIAKLERQKLRLKQLEEALKTLENEDFGAQNREKLQENHGLNIPYLSIQSYVLITVW